MFFLPLDPGVDHMGVQILLNSIHLIVHNSHVNLKKKM